MSKNPKMASGALFGGSTGRTSSKNLLEFRAGKMYMKGKMVHPDKRKGMVSIYQSDDSLMHFCWTDRTKGSLEDDLIIFPDDVEFKLVKQCTTGRVYLLKFKNMTRRMFFWMQEPKSDKDEEHCSKLNDLLNNPPTPGSSGRGAGGGIGSGGLPPEFAQSLGGDSDLQSLLGNMSQQQLMQLLGGMGMGGMGSLSALMGGRPSSATSDSAPPSRVQSSPGPRTTSSETLQTQRPVTAAALPSQTPTTSSSATSNDSATTATSDTTVTTGGGATTASESSSATSVQSGIQLSDLQTILSGMGAAAQAPKEAVDLSAAITPESMIPLLANKDIQEKLIPHLPEGESLPKTEEELRNTISTPQFQQAIQSFSAALASGQLGPLMGQFQLGDDAVAAANAGDVEAFAKAMQPDKKEEKMDEDKKE